MSLASARSGDSRSDQPATLDDALACVLTALESDEPLDRESLLDRFPQWADELNQFVENWLAVEHQTGQLVLSHTPPRQPAEVLGKVIGDYRLLNLISSGGMGVVYRAEQISLGRTVALKMVWNTPRDKSRFRIEAEAAASLHHAHIVSIYEVGEYEGQPFLSMQCIEGGNLRERLQAGPLSPATAAALVRTISLAVHYAHQRGILHRDLKPGNVLLDHEGKPYVSDFGLAKQLGNSVELTHSGAILGTPGYMSPEQAMGRAKSLTVAADVYGLGAILYATLTGDAPFHADSDLVTLRCVIEDPPVSPRIKRPQIDRDLETICLKCLEKQPSSRYASAKHLADDLDRYLTGQPVQARPVSIVERRWRWCRRNPALAALSISAALLLLLVVLASGGLAWREYRAGLEADYSRIREVAMRDAIDAARRRADQQNAAARQALADLFTTNGLWSAQNDLHGESLLWFTHAAELGNEDRKINDNKMRCLSWLADCPQPVAAC